MSGASYEERRAAARIHLLTTRRREVLGLIARDQLTNREIAERLTLSEATVESHVHHILHVLGVHTREEAARVFIAAFPASGGTTLQTS